MVSLPAAKLFLLLTPGHESRYNHVTSTLAARTERAAGRKENILHV